MRTETGSSIGARSLSIGKTLQPEGPGTNYFKVALDEIYVIKGALSAGEIQTLHFENALRGKDMVQKTPAESKEDP